MYAKDFYGGGVINHRQKLPYDYTIAIGIAYCYKLKTSGKDKKQKKSDKEDCV